MLNTQAPGTGASTVGRKSNKILSSELAVCLWIPLFPLRCEERRRPELATKPTALLSPDDTRRLWQVSPTARRMGVRVGMTVSQSIGLCPSLTLCEPDPVYYDEQFARLLLTLGDVSPAIEPAELGRAFIGVDGLEGLYGGPRRVLEVIARVVGERGTGNGERAARPLHPNSPVQRARGKGKRTTATHQRSGSRAKRRSRRTTGKQNGRTVPLSPLPVPRGGRGGWAEVARLGWGKGKFVSWVAATRAKPGDAVVVRDDERRAFLASQPVAVLPVSSDTHRRLWQLGIKTLADVARLPEAALTSQFGSEGGRAWRLAAGNADDPVTGQERPEPIVAAIDFPSPVADRAMLAHALDKLIERALKHPRRTGWRVHVVRVRAALEHGASWMIGATLKDPSADRDHIAAPLKVRLEHTPPNGAVEHLAVEFTSSSPGMPAPRPGPAAAARFTLRRTRSKPDSSARCSITSSRCNRGHAYPSAATR